MSDIDTLEDAVNSALTALSGLLSVQKSVIKVLEKEETTWRDASLGWPEPGKSYAMMMVDGYRVVLEAKGKKYEYRFGGGNTKTRSHD